MRRSSVARCATGVSWTTGHAARTSWTAEPVVEATLRLQFLLADRDEAVAVARRQRDETREMVLDLI
jgi:hypothetical protein